MKLLMISHLLGDFYLQTDIISEKKKSQLKYLLVHVIIYVLSVYSLIMLGTGKWVEYIGPMIVIGLGHMIIDGVKIKIEKTFEELSKYKLLTLTIDQVLHIIILWLFNQKYFVEPSFEWLPGMCINYASKIDESLVIIIAMLLCGKPAAIFVSLVFEKIPKTVQNAEILENEEQCIQSESLKIGSWVGMLEREIILILGVLGEFGAIGFVLAAKSLARHNQLNNQAFAEKYLVGTLLSALIALLSAVVCMGIK